MRKVIQYFGITMLLLMVLAGCSSGAKNSSPKNGLVLNDTKVTLELTPGFNTVQLNVVGSEGSKIDWSSSDSGTATVDSTGLVTAVKTGPATITATIDQTTIQASCVVTVIPEIPFHITPDTSVLYPGNSLTYIATPTDGESHTFTWSSDNSNISVNSNGTVVAKEVGTANLLVTDTSVTPNITVSKTINVLPIVTIKQPNVSMIFGQSLNLNNIVTLPNGVDFNSNGVLVSIPDGAPVDFDATTGTISCNQNFSTNVAPITITVKVSGNINGMYYDPEDESSTASFVINNILPPMTVSPISKECYLNGTLTPTATLNSALNNSGTVSWSYGNKISQKSCTGLNPSIPVTTTGEITITTTYTTTTGSTYSVTQTTNGNNNVFANQPPVTVAVGQSQIVNFVAPIPVGGKITLPKNSNVKVEAVNSNGEVVSSNTSVIGNVITGVKLTGNSVIYNNQISVSVQNPTIKASYLSVNVTQ